MVISQKYRYLFIELPHTASTAISRELCELYDGKKILHKHAHYHEFLKIASAEEKNYFVFASIRNPLDVITTLYFKRKTNHQDFYTNPQNWQINGGHVSKQALKEFYFITENEASFSDYVLKFHRIPYDSWGSPRPQDFDFVIRYENLQQDFAHLLSLLSIHQVRPLPTVNKTKQKAKAFRDYYSPDIYEHICHIFGPYMQIWDYDIPQHQKSCYPSSWNYLSFRLLAFIRKNIIWGSSPYAVVFRALRKKLSFITR